MIKGNPKGYFRGDVSGISNTCSVSELGGIDGALADIEEDVFRQADEDLLFGEAKWSKTKIKSAIAGDLREFAQEVKDASARKAGAVYFCTDLKLKEFLIKRCGFKRDPQFYISNKRRVYVMVKQGY